MAITDRKTRIILTVVFGCMACCVFALASTDTPGPTAALQQPTTASETPSSAPDALPRFRMNGYDFGPEVKKRPIIRIGVLARGSVANCAIRYKPTADYLTSQIDDYRFVIVPIRFDDFVEAVIHDEVDFAICNPLLYVELQALDKASAIATMRQKFEKVTFSQMGGVVFCRHDRDDIKNARDIRGKSFAAVSEHSFGGWVAPQAFLLSNGINPIEDASDFAFLETHSEVVREVTQGVYDIGTVRTGILERMAKSGTIEMDDYRIFKAKPPTSDFPFFSSTKLYPEWVFAKTGTVSEALANKVATTLYATPEDSEAARRGRYAGWITPASYQSVWECVEKVRDPYFSKGGNLFLQFFEIYGIFIVAIVGLIAALFYILSLSQKLKATNALMDRHTEEIVQKDKIIQDLEQRVTMIAGDEHENINVIRSDYRIEYLTPEWEAAYGSGVGEYCYEYFADRDSPCEKCGLRDAIKSQEVSTISRPFPREAGRPLEVTTIPLAKDGDGVQRFGQIYCDVQMQTRKSTLLATSQEREANYVLLKGVLCQAKKYPEESKTFLRKACDLICEGAPLPKVLDLNEIVQETVELISDVWKPVGGVSFDLAPEQPKVWAAERDMKMVLANLVLNAVRCLERTTFSSTHKGTITFSTRMQGGSVFLMVMDNGDGRNFMAAKELSAKPGHDEIGAGKFSKVGLFPTYERAFEKWSAKLRVHCTEENRVIRTVVMHAVTSDKIVPLVTGELNAADTMTPSQL